MIGIDERLQLSHLVDDTIQRWRDGEPPDAASFLAEHPEIGARRTLALDLIHEELCLRKESGDTIVASTFVERFPDYRSSVVKMLTVEQYGESHPQLAHEIGEALWPKVGQEYQGFQIVEPLGRGALARVYLARETAMGARAVVIKVSRYGGHEAHLLGKLEHDNIVAAHSVKQDEATGMTVICMPLLGTATGLDLLDAIDRRAEAPAWATAIGQTARQYQPAELVKAESLVEAFPFARRTYAEGIAWLGKELAQGLAAAGLVGVAHRDIKPSNVLLAWSGRPMLLDFNLSSGAGDACDPTGGTIAYMAPERIAHLLAEPGLQEPLDPRPDIFSLGVVLHELLTGSLPVQPADADRNDEPSLRRWLDARSRPIAPPSRFDPRIDSEVERIVLHCLAVDPDQRYATPAELAADLAAYLSPRQTAVRWARRNRRGVLIGGLAAAAGVWGGIGIWAVQPPLHERQFQRGLALFDEGKHEHAALAFGQALRALPPGAETKHLRARYLFARGQAHFWDETLAAAQQDFVASATLEPHGVTWFCAGCCSLHEKSGSDYLGKARGENYDPAAVMCNLGVFLASQPAANLRGAAIGSFERALELDPNLQPTYLERAYAFVQKRTSADEPTNPQALKDIQRAVALGPPSLRLYLLAAHLHAEQGKRDPELTQDAREFLRLWIQRGGEPQALASDSLLAALTPQGAELASIVPDAAKIPAEPFRGAPPPREADLERIAAPPAR
ncbi:MAG: serine/threonine-protein kinase [Pirellulaceae bacterium]